MTGKEKRQHMLLPVLFYIMIGVPGLVWAEIVGFELTIAQEMVSVAGATAEGMTINGNIPGPTLRFNEGDTAITTIDCFPALGRQHPSQAV